MKKYQLHELLIDAERRAAVAAHEAQTYRHQVRALLQEVRRINGAEDDEPVDGIVFLLTEEPTGTGAQQRCCACGTAEPGGRRFYENYKGDLFCWPCAGGKRPAKEASRV